MNYYLAQISVDNYISGKVVQVHMQVQYSLPTSYSATGLPSPGVVKTLLSTLHLLADPPSVLKAPGQSRIFTSIFVP